MVTTSESLLLRLTTSRDSEDAWARFVQLYTPLIFFWARKTGLSQHDAADLVQDVMAIVIRKLPGWSYDPQKSFRGWLRTVTLNRHREIARRRRIRLAGVEPDRLLQIADPKQAESTWDIDYCRELVAAAMQMMRPDFEPKTWQALTRVISGESAASVARESGISVWTIYSAKSRLLARLRNELAWMLD